MSVIALPANLKYNQYAWGVIDYELQEVSDTTGDSAARILGPSRWSLHFTSNPDMDLTEAARWEYLTLKLRGGNVLAAYDIVRKAPTGTMRGTPTISASVAVGATTMSINATGTLSRGDRLGVGTGLGTSQLIIVENDATASAGVITFDFNNPARIAFSVGTTITWDKPVAYFRKINKQATLGTYSIEGMGQGDFTFDLVESFG